MDEWSEYFKDFPEENPANQDSGRCDPALGVQLNRQAAKQEQATAEINAMITKANVEQEKAKKAP